MAVTAYPRRDTEENWIKNNPILKKDEICVVYTDYTGTMYKKETVIQDILSYLSFLQKKCLNMV